MHLLDDINIFCKNFAFRINETEEALSGNSIWKQRLLEVGVLNIHNALSWGISGVMLRSTGLPWDLRLATPYENYLNFDFNIPVGRCGDCYDRYLIRVEEMRQSVNIISQALAQIPSGPIKIQNNKVVPPSRADMKFFMESLIHHFKYFSEGFHLPSACHYIAVEAPKGETGVFLHTTGSNKPCKMSY